MWRYTTSFVPNGKAPPWLRLTKSRSTDRTIRTREVERSLREPSAYTRFSTTQEDKEERNDDARNRTAAAIRYNGKPSYEKDGFNKINKLGDSYFREIKIIIDMLVIFSGSIADKPNLSSYSKCSLFSGLFLEIRYYCMCWQILNDLELLLHNSITIILIFTWIV